jgi:hypothetical protein
VLFLDGNGLVLGERLIRDTVAGDGWELGQALAPLGDLDGNGTPDFVSAGEVGREILMLFLDPDADVVDETWIRTSEGGFESVIPLTHMWGHSLAFADLDGDGRGDWVVGSPDNPSFVEPGRVWVLRGSPPPFVQASPRVHEALLPGTAPSLTLAGEGYGPESTVSIDGVPVEPARVTVQSPTRLRVDLPQLPTLGSHEVSVAPAGGSAPGFDVIEIVPTPVPVLQIGNGNVGALVHASQGLPVTVAGAPGQTHYVLYSDSQLPSVVPGLVSLAIGNTFTSLDLAVALPIPAAGWSQTTLPLPSVIALVGFQSVTLDVGRPIPVSNLQQVLVFPL